AGAAQHLACDGERTVGVGHNGRQGNAALTGEVPQVEKLGRPGAGGDQSVHARIDAAVEDPDQDAAPVVGRVFAAELIHAPAVQRHQARQQRARRREDWGAAPCAPRPSHPAAVGRCGGRGRARGGWGGAPWPPPPPPPAAGGGGGGRGGRRGGGGVGGLGGGGRGRSRGGAAAGGERGEGGEGGGDGREGAQPHGRPVRAK